MNLLENFKIGIKNYITLERGLRLEELDETVITSLKLSFLTTIFGITTYSHYLDVEFGNDILEVMKIINNRKNFEYIKNKENHKKFIYVANLLENKNWTEWGTSIRGCWFNSYGNPSVNYGVDYYGMRRIEFDTEGKDIRELLEFLSNGSI